MKIPDRQIQNCKFRRLMDDRRQIALARARSRLGGLVNGVVRYSKEQELLSKKFLESFEMLPLATRVSRLPERSVSKVTQCCRRISNFRQAALQIISAHYHKRMITRVRVIHSIVISLTTRLGRVWLQTLWS